MALYRPDIPPYVAEAIRHFPPDIERSVKAAVRALSADLSRGEPLLGELKKFCKYRVRRFRIVYAIDRRRHVLRIVAVGHRRRIYEQMMQATRRRRQTQVLRRGRIKGSTANHGPPRTARTKSLPNALLSWASWPLPKITTQASVGSNASVLDDQ